MGVLRFRSRMTITGPLDLGSDASVRLTTSAANKLALGSGDSLDLLTNNNNLQLPGGTAAIGTAAMGTTNGRIRVGSQGGTMALALQINGTTYYILADGNL